MNKPTAPIELTDQLLQDVQANYPQGGLTWTLASEIERLRAELATFVSWGEWFTVEGLCNHNGDEPCTRTDHVKHPMFVRWEARRG